MLSGCLKVIDCVVDHQDGHSYELLVLRLNWNADMPTQERPELGTEYPKLSQQELDLLLDSHEVFVKGGRGGERIRLGMHDLSYLDFSGLDLSRSDFVGTVMRSCEFEETNLKDANLFAADLRDAVLVRANLDRADLRGAALSGANLTLASLIDCDMRDGVLVQSGEKGELLPLNNNEPAAGMERAKVRGADMSGAKVSDSVVVQTDLTDCNLKNAKFIRANLSLSNLTGCNLEGTDFTDANLSGAVFHGASLSARLWTVQTCPVLT